MERKVKITYRAQKSVKKMHTLSINIKTLVIAKVAGPLKD